jgi:putative oxidoreductase
MTTMNRSKFFTVLARLVLAFIYLFFGLDFFLHFTHSGPPDPATHAGNFLAALADSGYFFSVLKSIEVVCGLLLLVNWFVPLVLIILYPISVHIFLFNSLLAHSTEPLIISIVIILSNTYLAWTYRHVYAPLFRRNN